MVLYSYSYDVFSYDIVGKIATLKDDIHVKLYTSDGVYAIEVRNGFRWNGTTGGIPYRFHKTNQAYNFAIFVHDVLYHRIGLSKADADEILCKSLRIAGYSKWQAELIHFAVATFGRKSFTEDDEMTIENLDYITFTEVTDDTIL